MTSVSALLGDPGLTRLVDRLEQRVRRGRPLTGQIALVAVTPAEQAAIARLLGRPVGMGQTASVPLEQVEAAVVKSGAASDLAAAVRALRGPIPATEFLRAMEAERWELAFRPLDAIVAVHPQLAGFAAEVRRDGLVKRGTADHIEGTDLIWDLVSVLTALPTGGESLAAFSARLLQDAHALDRGLLRSSVDRALIDLTGIEDDDEQPDLDLGPERWAAVGVALDALSSSVLVHALPFDGSEPIGAALAALTATGQPTLVTLRMLIAGARPSAQEVFVCENPAVLAAAADAYGASSAPVVCVRGQPSAAAQRLLRLLADSGATLRYHGDFDWGGIRIANRIVERFGAVPWRYGTAEYRAADFGGRRLSGVRAEAVWDPALADAIAARGTRIEEEQVLPELLPDLGRVRS